MLEFVQHFFEHPLPVPISQPTSIQFELDNVPGSGPVPMQVPPLPEMSPDEKPDDLIMLELD
jgi:hypothetical protein